MLTSYVDNIYILNKYSKKIRDAREWLKEYLFDFSNSFEKEFSYNDLYENSEKFIDLINELNQFYDFEYEVKKENLFPKLNGNIISYKQSLEWYYMIDSIQENTKLYFQKNTINYDELKNIIKFDIYEFNGEKIYNYFKKNNYKYNEIEKIYEKINIFTDIYFKTINFLHNLLRELNVIKNEFYEFKDKMLSLNCDKPIGYHRIGEDETFFLLFQMEDNTFHLPTRMEEEEIILKNVKRLNDIEDIISAEITKETDVSLCDSIKFMKDFEDVSPNEVFYENWQIGFAS